MQVPREILHTPFIRYREPNDKERSDAPESASWNVNSKRFIQPADQGLVGMIDFRRNTENPAASLIVGALKDAFNRHGMSNVTVDPPSSEFSGTPNDLRGSGTEMVKKFTGFHSKHKICLVILPEADKKQYSQLKRVFDIVIGVHTVCVTEDKVKRKLKDMGFFANLTLKFNLKLGGINHVVEDRLIAHAHKTIGEILLKNVVVLGADVVHPPQGSRLGTPSIAAVVGNSDKSVANFPDPCQILPFKLGRHVQSQERQTH